MNGHFDSEFLETAKVVTSETLSIEAVEMGSAQLLVGHTVVEDMPDRDQDVVSHGDRRLLAARRRAIRE